MSLIAWWPLSGDIKDKIGNITQMGSTDITNTTGKIGSGYYFNGSTSEVVGILNANTVARINSGTVSVAMWVKLDTTSYGWDQLLTIGNRGTGWNDIRIGFDLSTGEGLKFSVSDGTNYSGRQCGTSAIHDGLWHHLVGTSSNGTIKLYVDGLLKSEKSNQPIPQVTTSQYVCIGGSVDERGQGCLQDVRIYDHVLSVKEVKELSKGLVLHYTFDHSTIESTTNLLPLGQQTQSNTAATIEVTSGLVNGATYTLSTYVTRDPACTSTNPRLTLRFFYSDGTNTAVSKYNDGGASYPKDGVERYYYITATADPSKTLTKVGGWLLDHSSGTGKKMTAARSQLEIKDHPTLYTPDTRSAILSNNTGINIENNISTANTIYSPDAAIGNGALKCSVTSLCTPIAGDITQGVTISCWVKGSVPTDSRVVFADHNSKLAFGFYNNGQAIITCAGYGHKCVTDIKTPWTSNWNHIVVRRDSAGIVKCFLNNNELSLNGSQEWTHSVDTFSIGGRYSGGWTSYFNGLVDDVRVYHTALSNDDIKELYNTRWSSNRQGQVFSNTINENQSKFQITRSGIVNCNVMNESGNIPSDYIPLQYLQSSGTQFINTNHLATQNTRTIFDYEYLNASASWAGLFGSDNNPTNNNMGYGLFLNGTVYSCYVSSHSGSSGCWNQQVGTWTQNQRTVLNFTHNKLIVDNVAYNLTTTTFTTSLVPMYLFSFRRSTGNAGVSSIRLYGCQILEGSTLVRNFIPAKRANDSVLGLYDTVNGIFYTNAGSGSFVAGPAAVGQGRNGNFYVGEFNEI